MILQRNSSVFLCALALGILLIWLMFLDAAFSRRLDREHIDERRQIVRALSLTDLCLFTEARYSRHPSMADFHTPFQDHPLSLEHFPSGSVLSVPPHLKKQTFY